MRMRFKRRADLHVPLQAWNKANLTVLLYALGKFVRCDLAHTRPMTFSALPVGMKTIPAKITGQYQQLGELALCPVLVRHLVRKQCEPGHYARHLILQQWLRLDRLWQDLLEGPMRRQMLIHRWFTHGVRHRWSGFTRDRSWAAFQRTGFTGQGV